MPKEAAITAQQAGTPASDTGLNSVLAKAHALLCAFQDGYMTLRLTDLAQRSGVPKTSVYRLAEQLVELGMLDRTADGYQLGIAMFEFSRRVPLTASLSAIARPLLVDLATTIRATVHVSVMENDDVLYVEKINGSRGFHLVSGMGARLPASDTASGRLLLSESPDREALVDRLASSRTGRTKAADLRREIDQVTRLGYAVERNEVARGWKSLAVAVRDGSGQTVAALSAVVPTARADEHEIVRHLRAAAGGISRRIREMNLPTAASATPRPVHLQARADG